MADRLNAKLESLLNSNIARVSASSGIKASAPAPDISKYKDVYLGDNWLSAGIPLQPRTTGMPRQNQYTVSQNVIPTPRGGGDVVTFDQLRKLADTYDVLRLVIEHVKTALLSQQWDIVAEERGEGAPFAEEIKELKTFFEKPDKQHTWDEWLSMVLEEVLVIDALALYKHRNLGSGIYAYEVIDGASIKPLIDNRGMIPQSPVPAYQQYLYGVPNVAYTTDEIYYKVKNQRAHSVYGYSPTEQVVVTVSMGLKRQFSQLAYFSDGSIPEGLIAMPEDWTLQQIKLYSEYWRTTLAGNLQERRHPWFIPGKAQYQPFKEADIYSPFDEWIARLIAFAFQISPTAFQQIVNRSTMREYNDQEAERGIQAIKLYIERLLNDLIHNDFLKPHLVFNWTTDRSNLTERDRAVLRADYDSGILEGDEVREELGYIPKGLGFKQQPATPSLFGSSTHEEKEGEEEEEIEENGKEDDMEDNNNQIQKIAIHEELKKWERKLVAGLKKNKEIVKMQFESKIIPEGMMKAVKIKLEELKSPIKSEDIKELFQAPELIPPRQTSITIPSVQRKEVGQYKTAILKGLKELASRIAKKHGTKV